MQILLLIIPATAVCWSSRVFARLLSILVVTRRCSTDESSISAAGDSLVFLVGESFSCILTD